jgi:outer membrane lipoprotein-sorting protein
MKRFLYAAALAGCLAGAPALAAPSPGDIVAAADRIRNPDAGFSLTNTLTEYVAGKAGDVVVLRVYAKPDAASGDYRNVVRFADPARDRGKVVLKDGPSMWFYDPASRASIRLSPQQRLMGQASEGDAISVNLAHSYAAKVDGEETISDGDKRQRDCWRLALTASRPEATYARLEYWVEKQTNWPVKVKFYSDSGRLLKILFYRKFQPELGGVRPTEVILIDGVDTSHVTRMTYSDFKAEAIPDSWFQREALDRVAAR